MCLGLRSLVQAALLGGVVAASWGCSERPDLVAAAPPDQSDASGFKDLPTISQCRPGKYEGFMSSDPMDGGPSIPFTSQIGFDLVQTLSAEFPVLENTTMLSGSAADGTTSFTAEILGGSGCIDGTFKTVLTNGLYYLGMSSVPFDGSIEGDYNGKYAAFGGKWTSDLHFSADYTYTVRGTWSASRTGPSAD